MAVLAHKLLLTCFAFMLLQHGAAYGMDASEVNARAKRLVDNWKIWLKRYEISEASIAISYHGKNVMEVGSGREAEEPVPVGSVSKAVTGICIAKLVEAGKISFEDTLESIVPDLKSSATVASLLTQTSGFTRDITQRPDKYIGRDQEYQEWVSRKEIEKGFDETQVGKFHYNNSNYAMLGAIIRKVTSESYENACKELVFSPIDIDNVDLNPDWRIHGAFGGWRISAHDHLKFLNAYFSEDSVMEKSPLDWPNHDFGNGLNYGIGYMFRKGRAGGYNFWHDGRWHADIGGEQHRFGAFFVSFDNGWQISVNHNFSAINGEHGELDRLIAESTHLPL